ncbi:MAG: dipeptide ABC transporter ATP-binding protein [Planctomycetota bacterium]
MASTGSTTESARGEKDLLVTVRDLKKYFPVRRGVFAHIAGHVRAVDGVSFDVRRGKTLGLVGESGCGKTTLGRAILRLEEPTEGEIRFDGLDVRRLAGGELRRLRRRMQIIFQDPYGSLNPRMTVERIIAEPLSVHAVAHGKERVLRVMEILERVGLSEEHAGRYPHEFSGGQRQRIGIARAIALQPDFIVCDEPVSALDVSIQAQILNLLKELQEKFGIAYLFIAHNLSVVKYMSDEVAVMYLGKIVELTARDDLYGRPFHPYTQALLSAIPVIDPQSKRERIVLPGDVPSPLSPPSGCPFHPRCPRCFGPCPRHVPDLWELAPGHFASCWAARKDVGLDVPE